MSLPTDLNNNNTEYVFLEDYNSLFFSSTIAKGSTLRQCNDGWWQIFNPDGTKASGRQGDGFVRNNSILQERLIVHVPKLVNTGFYYSYTPSVPKHVMYNLDTMNRVRDENIIELIPKEGESIFEIWIEGYATSGERSNASLIGKSVGKTFEDAVNNYTYPQDVYCFNNGEPEVYHKKGDGLKLDNSYPYPSIWACRLYDNEKDARKSFG